MAFTFGKVVDSLIAFRMVKILVQDWIDMDAYKLGIIDKDGNFLKKTRELKTVEEKKAFTKFHVIMFRLKQLLQKLPFGKTKLGSLAAALMLLKEETNTTDTNIVETVVLSHLKETKSHETLNNLCEHVESDSHVSRGRYILKEESITKDGELLGVGEIVEISDNTPFKEVLGVKLYEAVSLNGQVLYINKGIIEEC